MSLAAPSEGELAIAAEERPHTPQPAGRRPVVDPDSGEFSDVAIYARDALAPGAHFEGPAVIAEDDTSTVVSPNFDVTIDRFGSIVLTRREA